MTDTQVTWLTQEAHDRLKAELDQLIANRPVIAAEINDRREEGDLRENGGYHAAREEQGQEEARIRQLQELLNNAKVGEAPKQSGVALPGSVVKVYYDDDKSDTETFLIATRQEGVSATASSRCTRRSRRWARPDRRQGRRDPQLHRAQRQHRQGHAGQRRAVPLLSRDSRRGVGLQSAYGADRRGPVPAAAGQRVRSARSGTRPSRAGAVRPRCCSISRTRAAFGLRWPVSRSRRAGWWRSRRPGRWIPSSSRRSSCCSDGRCVPRPRSSGCPSTPRRTSPTIWSTWARSGVFG